MTKNELVHHERNIQSNRSEHIKDKVKNLMPVPDCRDQE